MASSALTPATPQRPLPGAFLTTPAPAPSIFSQTTQTSRQPAQHAVAETNGGNATTTSLSAIDRAAKTINDTLTTEARFPALEEYVQNGVTSEYELPRNSAWNPFQPLKQYDFPPKILEQANQSSIRMAMGMFAPLGHAWATIDNCLYLWDYTMPNPTLIGFEENRNTIEAIGLVTPRAGVFIKDITHVIVVATTSEMLLLGVAPSTTPTGAKTLTLYTTRMTVAVRGIGVKHIAGTKSGRIFFTGSFSDDIHEFTYRPDENWFQGRSTRTDYSKNQINMIGGAKLRAITQYISSNREPSYLQLLIDDSRGFLYTLDEQNNIQLWLIKDNLTYLWSRSFSSLLQSSGHFTTRTELLTGKDVHLASLSVIPAAESSRLALMAATNTGCRLYISLTRGFSNSVDSQNYPTQMAITHVRLPPTEPTAVSKARPQTQSAQPAQQSQEPASQYLTGTYAAYRIPPGYTILILKDKERNDRDRAFCLAEDTARLKNPQDTSALSSRFVEYGQWLPLPSLFTDMEILTADFAAASSPTGFGNELAVQYDRASLEMAIMTSSGIQVLKRRRVIDIFASLMRYGSADEEGIEGDIKKFIRAYGRGETAATALAVACGQGVEVTSDSRVAAVTDPDVLERARTAFIEHGGKPEYNANSVVDTSNSIDNVKPSPRHEGLALYISRLIRSIWKVKVVAQQIVPGQLPVTSSTVSVIKLRETQKSLSDLQRFLETNKSFIEGLSGPQAMARLGSRSDEIALQGEHRAMNSLLQLIRNVIEGISFALVLFDERLDEILTLLSPEAKQQTLDLTYEGLFVSSLGRNLAKELVKAIVNRNIAKGANVDTVAEALRRKCGSFCSADDVVTFKAQEQVKKAQEIGAQTESGRALLNESQRYFQKVAASLSAEHLQWAVQQYTQAQFWAGAILLCISVAQARDKSNSAIGWLHDGMADGDQRKSAFEARKACYDLIFSILNSIDEATKQTPHDIDGIQTLSARRRNEANEVINDSTDEVFQTCLYDWYISNGQADRLLNISSPFVVDYLKRRSLNDRASADLLWRYYAHAHQYLDAADVQYTLAIAYFDMSLEERIGYLGRARINASTRQASLAESRQSKQQLLRQISDQLEVGNIQDDILQKIKTETRISPERRPEIIAHLDGRILEVEELFNQYAEPAGYHEISLLIYQCADHRNPADIRSSWMALIEQTDREAQAIYGSNQAPWEIVGNKVREVGKRLHVSDAIFPVQVLLPLLERYALEAANPKPQSETWAVDVFLDLEILHETLLPVAEQIYYSNEAPFTGSKRRIIAGHMVHIVNEWKRDSLRKGERVVYGNEETARMVIELLDNLLKGGNLVGQFEQMARVLRSDIQRLLR